MSTLVITSAQTAGRALISTAKRYAVSYAKRRIRDALDPRVYEGPQLETFHLLTSRDGAPMARVYGRARLAGQVIWASRLKEHITEERVGGKGGPKRREYRYTISFAIGLCEGEIMGVDRLWVNGAPLARTGLTFRVYTGSADQLPDPVISAIEGSDAPAFRDTAYMVFEDFPLDDYGARLPQINAEVLRLPPNTENEPRLEDHVSGVNLLPSSGEYAYATDIVEDVSGAAYPVNLNNLSGQADIEQALDQLETQLPNCRNVSLIVSWFGTDLRAGQCEITPGTESRDRLTPDRPWRVCGTTRETAYLVSQDAQGAPHYGGTPSDASIIQAIRSLKGRGFKVSIYPFILMDVPQGNALPDPYGAAEQAAFPWRGRITSENDMSAGAQADIDTFFGDCEPADFGHEGEEVVYSGPDETSFRRFILHHAKLAAVAGGVDRFVIGSEMRGITTLRSGAGVYPAVAKFKTLAADVRAIVGSETGLTYAADWSEYFGHHDGEDVYYHLDPLWSDPNIDAVGIDAYFPLSDWRDGDHLDAANFSAIHDLDYLRSNVEGGEGYDWYYKNKADRDAQLRTPITDGAGAAPWVFRYKDIRNWWGRPHYNRPGGVIDVAPTAWQPKSKPIWFTEVGCPAIDKGANQPNVFVDPKSSESYAPYYSSGLRDDLIQRRYIEAFLTYWQDNNPASAIYSGNMIDMDAAHIWCWDARPYPDFPARQDIWADAGNWQTGHWLSGRTGLVALRDVVVDICGQSGAENLNTLSLHGIIEGYVLSRPMSALAALEPLSELYGFGLMERAEGLYFTSAGAEARITLSLDDILDDSPGAVTVIHADPETAPLDVRIHYIQGGRDYQSAMVSARDELAETARVIDVNAPVIMGEGQARRLAERILVRARDFLSEARFGLSPARSDIEIGDLVSLPSAAGWWRIAAIDGGVRAFPAEPSFDQVYDGTLPKEASPVPWVSKPKLFVLDIADAAQTGERRGVLVGAQAEPYNHVTAAGPNGSVVLTVPCVVGALLSPLFAAPIGRMDMKNSFEAYMPHVDLSSVNDEALMDGVNRFAVETALGWEILQARDITLIDENTYDFRSLLRGLAGTDTDMDAEIPSGARIVYLGQGLMDLEISNALMGSEIEIIPEAAGRVGEPVQLTYAARHLRPLAPVHGRAVISETGLHLSWIRRTREGGDNWTGLDVPLGEDREFYRVKLMGAEGVLAVFEVESAEFFLESEPLTALGNVEAISIRQGSHAFGYGAALTLGLPD